MAQGVKLTATQAWPPEFDTQNLGKGRRRETIPQSCPLTLTHAVAHAPPPVRIKALDI